MRFHCATCDQMSEMTDARVEEGILAVICETCASESRTYVSMTEPMMRSAANGIRFRTSGSRPHLALVRSGPGTRQEDFSVPAGFCPKCVAPRRAGTDACAHCGLVEGNFRPQTFEMSDALKASWTKVLQGYDDLRNHNRFVAAAFQTGELALAGRLYRIRLAREPGDPFARHGRTEVLRRAAAAATVLNPQPAPFFSLHVSRALLLLSPLPPLLALLYLYLSRVH